MKIIKRIIPCLIAFLIVISSALPVFADYSYVPYYFESYDVNINVLENNTLEITEKISAYFNEERHGIYRTIPLQNRIERADGSTGTINAKIKNIRVSENYTTDMSLYDCTIQIGDEDETIIGSHDYTISYSYVMGKDVGSGFDELYYNIIGDQWDTFIENVTFSITMPKEFDQSLVGFSSGEYGNAGTDSIEYYFDGNTVYGSLNEALSPYNAFTVRIELPEGYFSFDKKTYYIGLASMVLIPVIGLIAVIILWHKFGRDKKIVEVVEFYPPEGMSSADVAYWYKGGIQNTDLIPLMIELANEGYIEINKLENDTRTHNSGDFQIRRIKKYTGPDKYKKIFYDGLFACSEKDTVYKENLEDKFYAYLDEISSGYNTYENRKKVFNAKSLYMRILGWIISVLCLGLAALVFISLVAGAEKFIFLLAGALIALCAFILAFFIRQRTEEGHKVLQHLRGFKMFLETAEKEKLETLVNDDPKYFYDILPFAYVLGVSDEYIKNFEGIAIEPAQWYNSGVHPFNYWAFHHFMSHTMSDTTQAMVSQPQSSGGGFSGGGGGFSGGGAGGGGGGSW